MNLLFAAWCGFLWRVRGGAWVTLLRLPAGTTKARLATALLVAAPLMLGTPGAAALAPALFLGMVLAGWGDAMDIGRVAGSRWGDAIAMSAWGVLTVLPCAVVAAFLGGVAWPVLVAGVLFGPIYALAWHLPRLPRVPRFAEGPTEWAEAACGAAIGAALWVALP